MMIETEVKIRIDNEDLVRITNLLGEPNFVSQKNIIYLLPKGYLRVRFENDNAILTCKGERKKDLFKSRKEEEVIVDFNILNIIEMLGLERRCVYLKKRADYSFCDCVISLDIIDEDFYIEIEGNEKNILCALKELSLNEKEMERRSYSEIYDKKNNC